MVYKNCVEFKVYGKYALFTDPITKMGGEKFSYQIPTYQALKGIIESVYWKPTIIWYIDKVRVMKAIETESKNVRPIKFSTTGNELSIYAYLSNVEYQICAHFEWNTNREDLINDRNENKHYYIAKRMLEKGGRRDIFLGCRECQGYVEPCRFGEEEGYYDDRSELQFGLMFHGFDYPDESGKNKLITRLWWPVMKKGIITFIRPEDNEYIIRRPLYKMSAKKIKTSGFLEEGLLDGYDEEVVMSELDSKTI